MAKLAFICIEHEWCAEHPAADHTYRFLTEAEVKNIYGDIPDQFVFADPSEFPTIARFKRGGTR